LKKTTVTTSAFTIEELNDCYILIVDEDIGETITNDVENVIARLERYCQAIGKGGIGDRRVYYRDTLGRYDEILVKNGAFSDFGPCSPYQQKWFAKRIG